MNFFFSHKFRSLYKKLPKRIRDKFDKQLLLLSNDIKHPSLRVKKMQGNNTIWEARVDYHYRFTFNWENDRLTLRVIGAHDEVLKNP